MTDARTADGARDTVALLDAFVRSDLAALYAVLDREGLTEQQVGAVAFSVKELLAQVEANVRAAVERGQGS